MIEADLVAALKIKALEHKKAEAAVQFTAPYAIIVHEDLQARHPNGTAKYLELAIRHRKQDLKAMIRDAMKEGATLAQALKAAAFELLDTAQEYVPVNTGKLRDSGTVVMG